MTLAETDLIQSLLKNPAYLEQINTEMIPDDTLDLLNGTRRGKSEVKQLDHIVGVSDLLSRQKAKQQRLRAVTQGKSLQLQKSLLAFGVYLRKFFVEHVEKDDLALETQSFGKFILTSDPEADENSLYPTRIVYEPSNGNFSQAVKVTAVWQANRDQSVEVKLVKQIDFNRLTRLCRAQNTTVIKGNLTALANHLAQIVQGSFSDMDTFRGKTLRLNLRIGHLLVKNGSVTFEAMPVDQIVTDSKEQRDDLMSKVSSMSRISQFAFRKSSLASMKKDKKSEALSNFLDSSPEARAKVPASNLGNSGRKSPIFESNGGLQVTVNPITGHTQHFQLASTSEMRRVSAQPSPEGADKQTMVDFDPVAVGDISLTNVKNKNKKGGPLMASRSKIRDKKGIANLIAGGNLRDIDVDKVYEDMISNYESRSRVGGQGDLGRPSIQRGMLMKSSGLGQNYSSQGGIIQSHRQKTASQLPTLSQSVLDQSQSQFAIPTRNMSLTNDLKSQTSRQENANTTGYSSNPLLATARRANNTKMLSNLPSGKYFEMKDETMMPGQSQQFVQLQALQREQQRIKALDSDNVKTHNAMIQNLMAMDQEQHMRSQRQRKAQSQNAKYLRLQMNQKADNGLFEKQEHRQYQAQWEHTASQETTEHQAKVLSVISNRVKEQKEHQRAQKDAILALKVMHKQNEREVQQATDAASLEQLNKEKQIVIERKRQMQEMNKQVWLDQIALNRMHKKLNL